MAEKDSQNTSAEKPDAPGADERLENSQQSGASEDVPRHPGLKRLLGISLPVTVDLGRVRLTVEQLLQLGNGSVIELKKMAGEAAELYVRNAKVARGEVVVVDDNFGLRITEIVDWETCAERLQE